FLCRLGPDRCHHRVYCDASPAVSSRAGARALFPLPRPAAFYFKHQGPTEKGANQHEASEQSETRKCQLQRDRLHDVGRHQDLEAEQEGSTNTDLPGYCLHPRHDRDRVIGRAQYVTSFDAHIMLAADEQADLIAYILSLK